MKGTAATDTFTRTLATGWGSATSGQAWSLEGLGGAINTSDWSVNGTQGLMSVPVVGGYRHAYLGTFSQPYVDLAVDASIAVVPTGGAIEMCNLSVRGTSSTSYYLYRVQVETSASVTVLILAPGGATLGSITVPGLTYTANLKLRLRVQAVGRVFRAKVWQASNPEPPNYVLTVTDGTYTGAGWVGVRAGVASGNTNTLPIVATFDNFSSVLVPDFPRDVVPLTVLAAFGADLSKDPSTWTWTNITAHVRTSSVSVTPGRRDETSQASPASCSFQLLNGTRAYSANNPMSPNYPNVKRNTPIWVIVDPATRFFGYANGFVPSWDTTGKVAVVSVSASGILRRLTQGKSPLRSVLYRSTVAAKPAAHWSLEEGSTSTSFAESAGRAPMTWAGGPPKRASGGPPGSAPLVTLAADTTLMGNVVPYVETTPGWWGIQTVLRVPSDPGKDVPILNVYLDSGTYSMWQLTWGYNTGIGSLRWNTYDRATGAVSGDLGLTGLQIFPDGKGWGHDMIMGFNIHQSGANVLLDGAFASPDDPAGTRITFTATVAGTNGKVARIEVPAKSGFPHTDWTYGHISVWPGQFSLYDQQMFGLAGETVTARLNRLCTEQGIPITITGTSTTKMGPQGIDTFVNLLRECEAADLGLLYDGFGPGLGYVTRSARYSLPVALTLDVAAGQVAPPFSPADDDQRNRNLYKVDRKNGSSATYEDKIGPLGTDPIKGIGTYDSQVTLNVATDDVLPGYASWLVHMGTAEGFRYPNLNIDLAAAPELIDDWVAARLLSRLDVLNISSKATGHAPGTVSLLNEGYTETLGPKTWKVAANCSPYDPWRVFVVNTDRVDGDGYKLAAGVNATAVTLSVASTTGLLWVTNVIDPGAFPFDVEVAGIRLRVTNISGTSSPQTFTVTRSMDGFDKPLPANAAVRLWRPAVIAL